MNYIDSQLLYRATSAEFPLEERLALILKNEPLAIHLAEAEGTEPEIWRALCQHKSVCVWLALIQNKALPEELFTVLYNREERTIRKALARCTRTPQELLHKLSQSDNRKTVQCVAHNQNTSAADLENLSFHRISYVYRAAQTNVKNPYYVKGATPMRWVRGQVHPNSPAPQVVAHLENLAVSHHWWNRASAARSLSLPHTLMIMLGTDPHVRVRASLASNEKLLDRVMWDLASDTNWGVRMNVVRNPALPEEIARRLVNDRDSVIARLAKEALRRFKNSKQP